MKHWGTRTESGVSSSHRRISRSASSNEPSSSESKGDAFALAGFFLGAPAIVTLIDPCKLVRDGLGLTCASPAFGENFENASQVQHFANAFGTEAFALVALAWLYTLKDAAENDRLKSETYQRLALAMVLYSGSLMVAFGGAFAQAVATGEVGPSALAVGAVVASLTPAGYSGYKAIKEFGPGHDATWERVGKDFDSVKKLSENSEKGGKLELFYKVSFWSSLIVGGSFAFSPLSPLAIVNETAPSAQLIQRAFGLATCFLLAPTQYVLVDAASRGRLGGGTFKKLNLSIAVAIALVDWMTIYTFTVLSSLAPAEQMLESASGGLPNYYGALSVSGAIVAVYLYQGLFAKK